MTNMNQEERCQQCADIGEHLRKEYQARIDELEAELEEARQVANVAHANAEDADRERDELAAALREMVWYLYEEKDGWRGTENCQQLSHYANLQREALAKLENEDG